MATTIAECGLYYTDGTGLYEVSEVAGSMVILTDSCTGKDHAIQAAHFSQTFRQVRPLEDATD